MKIPKMQLTGEKIDERRIFQLTEDYIDGKIFVPKGFKSDGTSCPVEWYVDPEDPKYWPASVPHDYDYQTHKISKWAADWRFFKRLRKCGIRWTKAFVMWRAVRRFGKSSWEQGPKRMEKG